MNLGRVNDLVDDGVPLEDAITQTWTANRARDYGFGVARIVESPKVDANGKYTQIIVEFLRN